MNEGSAEMSAKLEPFIQQRQALIRQIQAVFQGEEVYWADSVRITAQDFLAKMNKQQAATQAQTFFWLGLSLGRVVDMTNPVNVVSGFKKQLDSMIFLFQEYDAYQKSLSQSGASNPHVSSKALTPFSLLPFSKILADSERKRKDDLEYMRSIEYYDSEQFSSGLRSASPLPSPHQDGRQHSPARNNNTLVPSQSYTGSSLGLLVPTPSTRRLTGVGSSAPSARSVPSFPQTLEFLIPESYVTNFDVFLHRVSQFDGAYSEKMRTKGKGKPAARRGTNPFTFFVCPNTPIDLDLSDCISTLCDMLYLIYNKLYDKACLSPALAPSLKKVDNLVMDRILKGLHALLTTTAKAVADKQLNEMLEGSIHPFDDHNIVDNHFNA